LLFPKRKKSIAVLWLLLTTVLLSLPGRSLPETGGDWFSHFHMDKWIHVFLFAILVFLWCQTIRVNHDNSAWVVSSYIWVFLSGIAYGVLMECVQFWLISGRGFEWGDILADAAGCALGCGLLLRGYKKISPDGNRGRNQN
jgi:VanZ family protein